MSSGLYTHVHICAHTTIYACACNTYDYADMHVCVQAHFFHSTLPVVTHSCRACHKPPGTGPYYRCSSEQRFCRHTQPTTLPWLHLYSCSAYTKSRKRRSSEREVFLHHSLWSTGFPYSLPGDIYWPERVCLSRHGYATRLKLPSRAREVACQF